jgi:hypothetical protein
MAALFDQFSLLHHQNSVSVYDRRQAMGDHDDCYLAVEVRSQTLN